MSNCKITFKIGRTSIEVSVDSSNLPQNYSALKELLIQENKWDTFLEQIQSYLKSGKRTVQFQEIDELNEDNSTITNNNIQTLKKRFPYAKFPEDTPELKISDKRVRYMRKYKTVDGKTINPTYKGNLNSFGLNIDSNFRLIDRISFCEYYMDRLMVYTIENPVVTSIKWGDSKMGDFSANDIQVTFKYEGITNDLVDIQPYNVDWNKKIAGDIAYTRYMVNKEIKRDVATFLQTRYNTVVSRLQSEFRLSDNEYQMYFGDLK